MTASVFDKLTPKQREVLGEIAVNQDGGHNPRALAALEKLGLIESYQERFPSRPPCTITRYRVPIGIHIDWCAWCAAQPDLEDT